MDTQRVIEWTHHALRMTLLLGGPLIVAALLVALVIGIFQTMTQMQEAVVSQVPRVGVILLVVFLILPWLITSWVTYARGLVLSLG
jgi:flagellar biosynthesis protein FliQ